MKALTRTWALAFTLVALALLLLLLLLYSTSESKAAEELTPCGSTPAEPPLMTLLPDGTTIPTTRGMSAWLLRLRYALGRWLVAPVVRLPVQMDRGCSPAAAPAPVNSPVSLDPDTRGLLRLQLEASQRIERLLNRLTDSLTQPRRRRP